MEPKVSIIIPTYNRPKLLHRALISVLAQTFTEFEVIVVDDGETIRSEGVVRGLNDPRFRYIAHEKSHGGSAARNTGIRASRAQFIAFLDDDDEWLPKKLEIQYGAFSTTGEDVGLSITPAIFVGDSGQWKTNVTTGIYDAKESSLYQFNNYLTVTQMVKRKVLDEVGYFDESLPSHQETDLVVRIAERFKVLGIGEALTRVDSRSGHGQVGKNWDRRISGREMFLKKHEARYKDFPKRYAFLHFTLALYCRAAGYREKAKKYFWKAFRLTGNPYYFFHWVLLLMGYKS